jgi:hypothetical protein
MNSRYILLAAALSGCATVPAARPEVSILGAQAPKVINVIIERNMARGNRLVAQFPSSVTFARRTEDFTTALLYGSKYDSTPEMRVTYTLVESGDGLKVFATAAMVTNPQSAYERHRDVTSGASAGLQQNLEQLRAILSK